MQDIGYNTFGVEIKRGRKTFEKINLADPAWRQGKGLRPPHAALFLYTMI